MKIMGRAPYMPGLPDLRETPVVWRTLRRRACARCGRRVRLTFWSPSTANLQAWSDVPTALVAGLLGTPPPPPRPPADGQCCLRCTRLLRSPGGAPPIS